MPFFRIKDRYTELTRAREIVMILIKHGLGDFFDSVGLGRYLKVGRGFFRPEEMKAPRLSPQEHFRLALEELGPCFIKFGQLLSTRPDMVSQEYAEELSKLQDSAPPVPWLEIEDQFRREFGKTPSQLFAEFNKQPVAAASLSQVHKARLKSGQIVAVKIQRPKIEKVIENDLKIMADLVAFIEARSKVFRLYSPRETLAEFEKAIKRELDFKLEGRNLELFGKNFADYKAIVIPKVFWSYTTSKILTMDFIEGVKVSEIFKIKRKGFDPKIIALNGAQAVLKQIFEDGLFHADPHPANIFILKNNRIALLDFGQVGRLDEEMRQRLADLLLAVVERDAEKAIRVYEAIEIITPEMDRKAIKKEIKGFMDRYWGIPLKDLEVGRLLQEMIEVMIKFNIKMPADFVLLVKALATIESVGRQIDPDFDMASIATPYAAELLERRWSVQNIWRRTKKGAAEFFEIFERLPYEISDLFRLLRRGRLSAQFELKDLDKLVHEIDRASNDIAFALIVAALIIGSSIVMVLEKGPMLWGYPAFGIIGYIISGILGIWLVIYILRRKLL